MSVLLLSADIGCSSRVSGAAASRAIGCETAMNAQRLLARLAEQAFDLVILDLTFPGLNCGELVSQMQQASFPPKKIVAFGPHVHELQLNSAREAGCDEVLVRGQFYAQAADLIERYGRGHDAGQST